MPLVCYAGRTKDAAVLSASSSGGIFTELARATFADDGVVIGAAWVRDDKGFRVVHKVADDESKLAELRGSKYVVSDMAPAWLALKDNLSKGRKVLFSGTPCQTAAVRKVYPDEQNLLLVSLICLSNVGVDVWHKWVQEVEFKARSRLADVVMRDKRRGWKKPMLTVSFENPAKNASCDFHSSNYGRSFASGLSVRDACCHCSFRSGRSGCDVMIGDLWGVENIAPQYDDNNGASAIIICTEKGRDAFYQMSLDAVPISYDLIKVANRQLEESPRPNFEKRVAFFRYLKTHSFSRALRIAEIGRATELKEHYYLSHPRLVNSLPMRVVRMLRSVLRKVLG